MRRNQPTRSAKSRFQATLIQATLAILCMTTTVGCFVPIYSPQPERRIQQLLFTSEDLRSVVEEWERFWHLDQPSHMTTVRTHGGII